MNATKYSPYLIFHELNAQCGPSFQPDDYHFIALIEEGSARALWKLQEVDVVGPCICFLGPLERFGFLSNDGIKGYVIQFKSEALGFGLNVIDLPFIPINSQQLQYTKNLFTNIRLEFELFENPDRDTLFLQLRAILSHAIRLSRMVTSGELKTNDKYNELQTLKNLVDVHFREHKSPVEYADLLNVSYDSLKKNMKKHLNTTVSTIIHQRVVHEARKELALTHKPIKEIASDLGFADQFYFSRLFKKVTGTSPDNYRNTLRQGIA